MNIIVVNINVLVFLLHVFKLISLKPVLNWVNVCSPEHISDTSTNYDLFLN